jgi:cytochrome c
MRPVRWLIAAVSFAAVVPTYAAEAPAGDPIRGQTRYEARCGGCHSAEMNRVGPKHRGVFGRKAGAVGDYSYSTALKKSGLTWDAATLDKWLTGPPKLVPGTKMGISVADAKDRADIIAYLATLRE